MLLFCGEQASAVENPSEDQILDALKALKAEEIHSVRVEFSTWHFLQAAGLATGGILVEYSGGSPSRSYDLDDTKLGHRELADLFIRYARCQPGWGDRLPWLEHGAETRVTHGSSQASGEIKLDPPEQVPPDLLIERVDARTWVVNGQMLCAVLGWGLLLAAFLTLVFSESAADTWAYCLEALLIGIGLIALSYRTDSEKKGYRF